MYEYEYKSESEYEHESWLPSSLDLALPWTEHLHVFVPAVP